MRRDTSSGGRKPLQSGSLEIGRVPDGHEWLAWLLSDQILGFVVEWTKEGGQYVQPAERPRVMRRPGWEWRGYSAALIWQEATRLWHHTVLEVNSALELDLRDVYQRGQVWSLKRGPKVGKRGQAVRGVLHEQRDSRKSPAAFDLLAVLFTVYHVEGICLDLPNPAPARTPVDPCAYAPPIGAKTKCAEEPATPEQWRRLREVLKDVGRNGQV